MALNIQQVTTKFIYNGKELSPPEGIVDPEQVRQFYAAIYPELNNASITSDNSTDGEISYTFQKAVGTKG